MTKQKLVEITFNVGDVVQLVKLIKTGENVPLSFEECLGDLAVVTEIDRGIALYFRNHGYQAWFKPEQLKLVKKFEWPEV